MRALGLALAFVLLAGGACTKKSELYCAQHPDDTQNCAMDVGPACDLSADCASSPATPVCEVNDGVCVVCLPDEAAACTGATPVCEGTSCRGCNVDAECSASNFCLSDGRCAAVDDVAFVSSNGTGDVCTREAPCDSLRAAAETNKPYIKVTSNVFDDAPAIFSSGERVLHGGGVVATVMGGNSMFEIANPGTSLEIHGLEMTTTDVGTATAVIEVSSEAELSLLRATIRDARGPALEATGKSLVIIRRSVIATNRTSTAALSLVDVEYDVTNTLVVNNGMQNAANGGVRLEPAVGGRAVFAFNTVAGNVAMGQPPDNAMTGIVCVDATVDSSIIAFNRFPGCRLTYTLWNVNVMPGMEPSSMTNMRGVPTFLELSDYKSAGFYRLAAGSLGIDAADPEATLNLDIDGQPRPANGRSDMGVDEVQ